MSGQDDTNVKVWGRIRPLKPTERRSCMTVDTTEATITLNARPTAQKFTLDGVLTPDGAQVEMFEKTAKPITDACMLGFNGTIFAYGQTGSGALSSRCILVCLPSPRSLSLLMCGCGVLCWWVKI